MNIGMKKIITLLVFLIGQSTTVFAVNFDEKLVPVTKSRVAKPADIVAGQFAECGKINKALAAAVVFSMHSDEKGLLAYFSHLDITEFTAEKLSTKELIELKQVFSMYKGASNIFAYPEIGTFVSLTLVSGVPLEYMEISVLGFLSYVGYVSVIEHLLDKNLCTVDPIELTRMAIHGRQLATVKFLFKRFPNELLQVAPSQTLLKIARECLLEDEANELVDARESKEIFDFLPDLF